MKTRIQLRAFLGLGALTALSATLGCVADRPSRNGVFNENQYIRKDFLVRPGDDTNPDNGWMLKATVTDASEPNVFGGDDFGLFAGSHNDSMFVHFVVTSDRLQMVNNREISTLTIPTGRQGEVVNAWPVTNVDLKYQINLDGEKTNFYIENQELDWQVRQWVKINLDNNNMNDLAPLGSYYNANVSKCVDSDISATLVPNSFQVDEAHDYMEWKVQVSMPIKWSDASCVEMFGAAGKAAGRIGREFETVTLKYSMARTNPNPTYTPLVLDEKDPIRHKYGPITYPSVNRDPTTNLLASNEYVIRFDPTKEIKWYFEKGFPDTYKKYFTAKLGKGTLPTGVPTIEDGTNALLADAKSVTPTTTATVSFHEYNEPLADGTKIEREFGDVRFNMLRWLDTADQGVSFAGATSPYIDPRTGEALAQDIVFSNFPIQDYYTARIDAYLQSIGASEGLFSQQEWTDSPQDANGQPLSCSSSNLGASLPIIPAKVVSSHNGLSTLFQKIQQYLFQPISAYGPLGPQDFIKQQDDDFRRAYYAYLPYIIYMDSQLNPFVEPEGGSANTNSGGNSGLWSMVDQERQFHAMTAAIDHGQPVFNPANTSDEKAALDFLNQMKSYSINHRTLRYARETAQYRPNSGMPRMFQDQITDFSMEQVMQKDARHCVDLGDGKGPHWESKQEWMDSLVQTYWSQVFWHEFGHAMGLEHNFMASIDKPNFPAVQNPDGTTSYKLYASSVMEYNATADRIFWGGGWAPYDVGAITWIYANNGSTPKLPQGSPAPKLITGQIDANTPWKDPHGFNGDQEISFLYCDARHMKYTPLCRAGDLGTTPSEIVANDIDAYEWQYKWRNFRQYRKIWSDLENYADQPLNFVTEMRRMLSLWAFDMSGSELTAAFERIGITPPPDAVSSQFYYAQLGDKFNDEMSHANSLMAAFHEAIIQQSSGQRPYVTQFDAYFGDTTLQGITLDKLFALQSFLALWPVDNYDENQAAGTYISSFTPYGVSDELNGTAFGSLFQSVSEAAADSMIGGAYSAFAYFKPLGVGQFAQDTHSINWISAIAGASRTEVRDWTGGYIFSRLDDFLAFFQELAVQNNYSVNVGDIHIDCTKTLAECNYDPRTPRPLPADTFYSDNTNQFVGPDGRRYIWVYVKDRNQWIVADRDRNSATYQIMFNYTLDVIQSYDDGNYSGPAFDDEQQIKYFLDYYAQFNAQQGQY